MEQHRRVRWPAVVGWALALSVLASPAAATSASAATMKWDTPGVYQWVVPADITTVTFDLYGGSGGDAGASKGGHGGHSVATFAVTPGETLSITVGGAGAAPGAGGSYGGGGLWGVAGQCTGFACYGAGGGGASDVRQGGTAATNRVLVAGGGGGAGGPSSQACGNGGCADSVGGGDGADGGALSAGRGSDGATYIVENPPPGLLPGGGCGGGGGTQSAAGTNPGDGNTTCHGPSQNTHDGFQELGGPGGDGASGAGSGGGGAGGYWGGAGGSGGGTTSSGKPSGGNNGGGGGGGGGGSGFAIPAATGVTITGGQQLGDGTALVTYGAAPTTHTLSVTESGPGSVASSPAGIDCGATCSHGFDEGTAVTLTATPGAAATFSGWSGACSGTGACTVTMSADHAVGASFATTSSPPPSPQQHVLSVTESGPGSVISSPAGIDCGATCTHAYDEGTAVTLTPTPASGATFGGWSGACSGTGACTVTMSAAEAVTATFNGPTRRTPGRPDTKIKYAHVSSTNHRATFGFVGLGGVAPRSFLCKLDRRGRFQACSSPLTYRKLKPGKHTFEVKAVDSRGKADRTPATKRFGI